MNPVPKPDVVAQWIAIAKDLVLSILGIFVILHETLAPGLPRVFLLAVAAAALGLPFADFLRRKQKNGHNKNEI